MNNEVKTKAPRKNLNVNMKVIEADSLLEIIRSIGLDTVGDMAQIILKHPEVIEAFKPHVAEQMKYLDKVPLVKETALEKRLRVLRQLDPEKYKKIVGMTEE
jgi:hypothetical protein